MRDKPVATDDKGEGMTAGAIAEEGHVPGVGPGGESVSDEMVGSIADPSTDAAAAGPSEEPPVGQPHPSIDDLVAALGVEKGRTGERQRDASVQLVDRLPIDAADDVRAVEGEASPRMVSIIESLLFAATGPLTVKRIRKILAESSNRQIQLALKHLIDRSAGRGIQTAQVAGGFVLRTNPDNASWVQQLIQAKPVRLSRPQVETLALIAYRQPVTRVEVDHVRGVDTGAVIKVLMERDLIKIVGRREDAGRPLLYGTTVTFLEFFSLMTLRDLPSLKEFHSLSDDTKEVLRKKMDDAEVEALGQEVLDFAAGDSEGGEASDEGEGADVKAAEAAEEAEEAEGAEAVVKVAAEAEAVETAEMVAVEAEVEVVLEEAEVPEDREDAELAEEAENREDAELADHAEDREDATHADENEPQHGDAGEGPQETDNDGEA
ncbi:MAG: SMC-Scp complex subunit ScpB [Nannocystaceae bacterium]